MTPHARRLGDAAGAAPDETDLSGLSAVVIRSVEAGQTVVGGPARPLR